MAQYSHLDCVPSRTKLVQTGQLTFLRPSVRMVPVTLLSLLLSPPYLSSSLSSSVRVTLSLAAELWSSKFRLGCRHLNSVRRCGRGQRPLLDPVVPNGDWVGFSPTRPTRYVWLFCVRVVHVSVCIIVLLIWLCGCVWVSSWVEYMLHYIYCCFIVMHKGQHARSSGPVEMFDCLKMLGVSKSYSPWTLHRPEQDSFT